jgi:hypothetical protein
MPVFFIYHQLLDYPFATYDFGLGFTHGRVFGNTFSKSIWVLSGCKDYIMQCLGLAIQATRSTM